ncbi:MAG TPA: UbiA prenyltransferase family protein [Mycobacteriales bacterium]|nr:UbiA prenyltransferase family protein [Mycobacteriales bacterium]
MVAADPPLAAPLAGGAGAPLVRRRGRLASLAALARPGQWTKCLLAVPLALLDSPTWSLPATARVAWAVLAFVLASSVVYVINDIGDREIDRRHPVKRLRPIAADQVTVRAAGWFAAGLALALAAVLAAASAIAWWPLFAYLVLNIVYSRWLKHIPLLDVFAVASGFVLRAVQGYVASGIPMSEWLLICVFSACLLLSLGKRRHELIATGGAHRPALTGYSVPLLDQLITLCAALTLTTCLLYLGTDAPPISGGRIVLLVSVPCALFAVFRYLQTLWLEGGGGNPVGALVGDPVMVATFAVWTVAAGLAALTDSHPALVSWLT